MIGRSRRIASRRWQRSRFAAAWSLVAALAFAEPEGGQIVSGLGGISQVGSTTTINQSSPALSLTWKTFNVATNETVNFVQPSAAAIAVNRISDLNGSQILGRLNANGQIFLINPNGILFGPTAQVNVGGLVASTLDLHDASLDREARTFSLLGETNGRVVNRGTLQTMEGGYVALLGNTVSNHGTIVAPAGTVALGAGTAATLTFRGQSLVQMQIDRSVLDSLAENGGLIHADGGVVLMSAGAKNELLASVVNNTGMIQARRVEHRGGTIILLGGMKAGSVNVSGTLDASAAGSDAGDGGFIETSAAHVKIGSEAKITTAAAASGGLAGTWLIDPLDFTIAASGGDITGAALSGNLGGGNVIIQSTAGAGGSAGNVNVNDAVTWSANQLTLNAQNNIAINANLNGSGTASLALEFGQGAVAAGNTGNVITTGAAVNLPASTINFTTKQGSDGVTKNFTVITSLGLAGSVTGTDLQGMSGGLAANYALGANIDATATSGWNAGAGFAPVGSNATRFTGTFDGLGHTVSGLMLNRTGANPAALFGVTAISAVVRNVGLIGGSVSSDSWGAGSLVGLNSGTVSNSYATGTVSGYHATGGLVGTNDGVITDSYATGVSISYVIGEAGGLVGWNAGPGSIINSYATGNVSSPAGNLGGLVGINFGSTTNSYATGRATGGNDNVGGLVGWNDGLLSASYATGAVTGGNYVGGLTGNNSGTISDSNFRGDVTSSGLYSGGFAGYNNGTITSSYAVSTLQGSTNVGGLVGRNQGTIQGSYASGTVFGDNRLGGLAGVNTSSIANSYSTASVTSSGAQQDLFGGLVGANSGNITNSYASGLMVVNPLDAGGLIGLNQGGAITNSYWNTETTGQIASSGGTARTTAQMQTAANFAGFNFTTIPGATGNNWVMVDLDGTLNNAGAAVGATFPMLAWEYSTTIRNAHQLQLIVMAPAASYTLGANVDAAATATSRDVWGSAGFAPIGSLTNPFTGIFDGRGRTISALTINVATANVGLFGDTGTGAAISNVGLVGGSVTGAAGTGGLVGNNGAGVSISNSYTTGTVIGAAGTGGLVGSNTTGSISNSYATGNVTGAAGTGGLVGSNTSGAISTSFASGAVNGAAGTGGLIGSNTSGSVSNSYATGNVLSSGAGVGGLIGSSTSGIITNTYAIGNVSSPGAGVGGLIGSGTPGVVTNSYWNTGTSGQAASPGGGLGQNTAQMQQQSTYNSWDFATTWTISNTSTYPLLRGFMTPLTVTANNESRTYSGVGYSGGNGVTYTGLISGVTPAGAVSFGGTAQGAVNAGGYLISPGGLQSNQQYAITFVAGTLTINPAHLTVTADAQSRLYGEANPVFTGTLSGFVNGETALTAAGLTGSASATTTAIATTNIGTALITAGAGNLAATNYDFTNLVNGTLTINRAHLTVTAGNATRLYGETNPTVSTTLSGFANGETILTAAGLTGSGAATTTAIATTNVGTATLTAGAGNLAANNYDFTNFVNGTLTINRAHLTVAAGNATRLYGEANPAFSTTLSGFANGETALTAAGLTGSGNATTTALATSNVGTATITAGAGNLAATNYEFTTLVNGTLTINRAHLTVTADDASRLYGQANPTFTSTLTGFVNGETAGTVAGLSGNASITSPAVATTNVGTSAITAGAGTLTASNYDFTNGVNGTLTINRAALSVIANSAQKIYDGQSFLGGNGVSYAGFANGETSAVLGGSLAYSGTGQGATNAGSYVITPQGLAGNNYALTFTSGALTIDRAALSAVATVSGKTYDGNTNAFITVNSLSGLIGAETLAATSSGTFDTRNAGLNKTVTVAFTLGNGTGLASNYTLANGSLTGDITPKALTVSGSVAANKIYDSTTSATITVGTLSGFVAGETLGASAAGFFADKNVATNKTVIVAYTLSDGLGLASNYRVANQSLTAEISRRALAITGITASDKVYDSTTVALLGGSATVIALGGDVVGATGLGIGVFADKNVGAGKIVTVNGFALTGADAGNYTIVQPTNVTARITAANLAITGVGANDKIYDGTGAATLNGAARVAAFAGDSVGVSGSGIGLFTDKNAGNHPVIVTGFTLSGVDAGNYTVVQPAGITASITSSPISSVIPEITLPRFNALAQFKSSVLSAPASARAETLDLSSTFTMTRGPDAETLVLREAEKNATLPTTERLGPALHVVNGGIRLPASRVNLQN